MVPVSTEPVATLPVNTAAVPTIFSKEICLYVKILYLIDLSPNKV